MTSTVDGTPDDELLSILLRNLRNAAATWGEGTPHYESIRTTVQEHLNDTKAKGLKTHIVAARQHTDATNTQTTTFTNLVFRPKPGQVK